MQLPDSIAFSFVAGVDPMIGLYSTFITGLFGGLFGGRSGMINGAAGALAVIVKPLMEDTDFTRAERLHHVFSAVIFCGIFQLLAGLLQLPRLVKLIPRTAMFGFLNGLAVIMFQAQMDAFKSCSLPGVKFGDCPSEAKSYLSGDEPRLWISLVYVFISMALCLWLQKLLPSKIAGFIPGTLVSVVICSAIEHGIVRTASDESDNTYVRTVDETALITSDAPKLIWPFKDVSNNAGPILAVGVWMALVGIIESIMTLQTLNDLALAEPSDEQEAITRRKSILEIARAREDEQGDRDAEDDRRIQEATQQQQEQSASTISQPDASAAVPASQVIISLNPSSPQSATSPPALPGMDVLPVSPPAPSSNDPSAIEAPPSMTVDAPPSELPHGPTPLPHLHPSGSKPLPPPPTWSSLQECLAQGLSNVVASFVGSMGGCAMVGQTVSNFKNGGRGRLSSSFCGLVMLLFIVVLGPAIKLIPIVSLAGVIFVMVLRTFAWPSLYLMKRMPLRDILVIVAVTAIAIATHNLAIAVIAGVAIQACGEMWVRSSQFAVSVSLVTAEDSRSNLVVSVENCELCFATVSALLSIPEQVDDEFLLAILQEATPLSQPRVVLKLSGSRVSDLSALLALGELSHKMNQRLQKAAADFNITDKAAIPNSPPPLLITALDDDSKRVLARWGGELKDKVLAVPSAMSVVSDKP